MPFKKLLQASEEAKAIRIKGITGIKRALIKKEKDEYVIYTEGSNLEGVLDIPGVDPTRTTTNSVFEIYKVFGVEAAARPLIHEASRTLCEQGLGVDIRHLMLVADVMTNEGDIRAIGRHGISGKKTSVLARAAFEITAAHLLARRDHRRGRRAQGRRREHHRRPADHARHRRREPHLPAGHRPAERGPGPPSEAHGGHVGWISRTP